MWSNSLGKSVYLDLAEVQIVRIIFVHIWIKSLKTWQGKWNFFKYLNIKKCLNKYVILSRIVLELLSGQNVKFIRFTRPKQLRFIMTKTDNRFVIALDPIRHFSELQCFYVLSSIWASSVLILIEISENAERK